MELVYALAYAMSRVGQSALAPREMEIEVMKKFSALTAIACITLAGTVVSAVPPVIDGTKDAVYGAPKWVNVVPSRFGDNVAGAGGSSSANLGNPELVTTGIEFAIPKAAIGYTGGSLKLMVAINNGGQNFLSNQLLGGLPSNTSNLGGNFGAINFATIAGTQTITLTPATITTAPTIDGTRDAAYGTTPAAVQTTFTQFGNPTHGQLIGPFTNQPGVSNGSEINNLFVVQDANFIYLMAGGNLENNFNKFQIFIDTDGSGQNVFPSGTNSLPMGGMTFEAGFAPNRVIAVTGGGGGAQNAQTGDLFVDTWTIPSSGAGTKAYAGRAEWSATSPATIAGGEPGAAAYSSLQVMVNNSNILGVPGSPVGANPNAAPNVDFAYGSEINAVYSHVEAGRLYVLVTGNIETPISDTSNNLVLFFDVGQPGQNRLRGNMDSFWPSYRGNVDIDFGGLGRMGAQTRQPDPNNAGQFLPVDPDDAVASGGLTFDQNFSANYFFTYTNSGVPVKVAANAAVLRTAGRLQTANGNALDYGSYEFGDKGAPGSTYNPMTFSSATTPLLDTQDDTKGSIYSNLAPRRLQAAWDFATQTFTTPPASLSGALVSTINNLNVDGLPGWSDTTPAPDVATLTAAATAVTTGVEMSFDLAELGYTDPTQPLKLAGFIATNEYNIISNQVLGGIPTGGSGQQPGHADNLNEPRAVNFANIAGDQFIVILPGVTGPTACNSADIADNGSNPGADGCVDNGDFSLFISQFFNAGIQAGCTGATIPCAAADIADNGSNPGADGLLDNGDFSLFISAFFGANCTTTCNP
jgi:hypothetical protein